MTKKKKLVTLTLVNISRIVDPILTNVFSMYITFQSYCLTVVNEELERQIYDLFSANFEILFHTLGNFLVD